MGNPEIYPLNPLLEIMGDVKERGVASRGFIDHDEIKALVSLGYTVEEHLNYFGDVAFYRVLETKLCAHKEEEKPCILSDCGYSPPFRLLSLWTSLKNIGAKKA